MSTSPAEPVVDAATALGNAAKALADADKTRAEADKVRADADRVRAETLAAREVKETAANAAAEDLRAKVIANDLARTQADAARTDKLIEQLGAAIPDLASLNKSTVTFSDGKALRQRESICVAVEAIARGIAADVAAAVSNLELSDGVFVVSDPDLVSGLAAYERLRAETTGLDQALVDTVARARKALQPTEPTEPTLATKHTRQIVPDPVVVAAAVAGKAVTQLASLFELDVDVSTSTSDIPALAVQTAVIGNLLAAGPELKVRHEKARAVNADQSRLLTAIDGVISTDIEASKAVARLDAAIAALGDPAARLADATKQLKDNRPGAAELKAAAQKDLSRLAALTDAHSDLVAVMEKTRVFLAGLTEKPESGGPGLLARALHLEPLTADDNSCVLVLGDAKAETYQAVVKRRLLAPRLQTSTSVEVDYLLIKDAQVVAAGHHSESVSYAAVIKGSGPNWKPLNGLGQFV